jgi:hypothetical protein
MLIKCLDNKNLKLFYKLINLDCYNKRAGVKVISQDNFDKVNLELCFSILTYHLHSFFAKR